MEISTEGAITKVSFVYRFCMEGNDENMIKNTKKYLAYIRCGFLEGCAYRSTFITGMLANFIQAIVLYYLEKYLRISGCCERIYLGNHETVCIRRFSLQQRLFHGIRDEYCGTDCKRRYYIRLVKTPVLQRNVVLSDAGDCGNGICSNFSAGGKHLSDGKRRQISERDPYTAVYDCPATGNGD